MTYEYCRENEYEPRGYTVDENFAFEEEEEFVIHKSKYDMRKSWKSYRDEYNYSTNSFKSFKALYRLIDIIENEYTVPYDKRFAKISYDDDFTWKFIKFEELESQFDNDYDNGYEYIHNIDMTIYKFNEAVFDTRLKICSHIRKLIADYNVPNLSANPNWKEIDAFLVSHGAADAVVQPCS